MERDRKGRIIAVTSMLVAVIVLTIAYAVFSKNLNIQNMSATVNGNAANFSVKFSNSSTKIDESDVVPEGTMGKIGLDAHIDNSGVNPKLTNLSMEITRLDEDGIYDQNYPLFILNDGAFDAYLKSIKIANVSGYDKPIVCLPKEGTSKELVDKACKAMTLGVSINTDTRISVTSEGVTHGGDGLANQSGNYTGITGMKLLKNFANYHKIEIWFWWTNDLISADGPYEIKIGDITVEYSTQDV